MGERSLLDRFLDELFEFETRRFDDVDRALHEGWLGRSRSISGSNCFDLELDSNAASRASWTRLRT